MTYYHYWSAPQLVLFYSNFTRMHSWRRVGGICAIAVRIFTFLIRELRHCQVGCMHWVTPLIHYLMMMGWREKFTGPSKQSFSSSRSLYLHIHYVCNIYTVHTHNVHTLMIIIYTYTWCVYCTSNKLKTGTLSATHLSITNTSSRYCYDFGAWARV